MREKRNSIKRSISSQFSRSIIIPLVSIFLLLVIAVIAIVFIYFVSELSGNIKESKKEQLKLVEENISSRLKEIETVSYHVSADSNFFLNPDSDNRNAGYIMSEMLKRFMVGNDFMSYLTYYRVADSEKIYTSSGEMSFRSFWNGTIGFEDYTEEEFAQLIQGSKGTTVVPMLKGVKGKEYLTLIHPIPPISRSPVAFVTTFVSNVAMHPVVQPLFTDCYGEIIIFDSQNRQLYQAGNAQEGLYSQETEAIDALDQKRHWTIKIDGIQYIIQKHTSSYNNWTYMSVIRANDIMSSLNRKQYRFLIVLFLILIIAVIATITSILIKYNPINQLAEIAMAHTTIGNRGTVINEQNLLSNAFTTLIEEKYNMYQKIFYSNLLADQYDEESSVYAMNEYNIRFDYPYYSACSIYISNDKISKELKQSLLPLIEEYLDMEGVNSYFIYRSNPDRILVLMNRSGDEILWEQLERRLTSLHGVIYEKLKLSLKFGIGNLYFSILELSLSVKEATNAMYFSLLKENGFLMLYKDIEVKNHNKIIKKHKSYLIAAVRNGAVETIPAIINELESNCTNLGLSQVHMSYIAYNIITSLFEYAEEPELDQELRTIINKLIKNSYIKLNVLWEVEKISVVIAKTRKSAANEEKDELMKTIKEMISKYLCDSSLSLEKLASLCGISSSYLSRYFKANMDCTPMKYVENLRMDLVKESLCHTDKALKEILEETGYIDQSNFIRKFKRNEGVTPITYRKFHGKSST